MIYFRPPNCLFLKNTDEYSSVKAMMPEDDSKKWKFLRTFYHCYKRTKLLSTFYGYQSIIYVVVNAPQ